MARDERTFLIYRLTDVMARVLHYQERGEPDLTTATYEQAAQETERLPEHILQRYLNEPRFHAQVTRAVALVLRAIPPTPRENENAR